MPYFNMKGSVRTMLNAKFARDIDRYLISVEEEKPVAFDWQDGEIYAGDEYYQIGDDLVLKDDLKEYIESVYGKAVTA